MMTLRQLTRTEGYNSALAEAMADKIEKRNYPFRFSRQTTEQLRKTIKNLMLELSKLQSENAKLKQEVVKTIKLWDEENKVWEKDCQFYKDKIASLEKQLAERKPNLRECSLCSDLRTNGRFVCEDCLPKEKEHFDNIIADKDRQIEELKTDNKALYLGQLSELVSMKSSIRAVMKKVVDGTNRHEILSDLKRIVGDKD